MPYGDSSQQGTGRRRSESTGEGQQRRPHGRRSGSYLKSDTAIDYKNIELLERFVDDGGRITSRRKTRTNAKQQRAITAAIKRARHVALLPFAPQFRQRTER
jgi:small subunit ribosomal protein S18